MIREALGMFFYSPMIHDEMISVALVYSANPQSQRR
jgi:hypothetical protein